MFKKKKTVDHYCEQAEIACDAKKFTLAIVYFDKALKAIVFFDNPLKKDQQMTRALNGKGNALCKIGIYDAAIACFDIVLTTINPSNGCALEGKGAALEGQGKYEEASKCYLMRMVPCSEMHPTMHKTDPQQKKKVARPIKTTHRISPSQTQRLFKPSPDSTSSSEDDTASKENGSTTNSLGSQKSAG